MHTMAMTAVIRKRKFRKIFFAFKNNIWRFKKRLFSLVILSQTPAIGAKNRCNPAGNSATPGASVVVSLAVTEKYENGFYLVHFILSTCLGRDLESTQFFVHSKHRSVPRSLEPRTSICACTMTARDYCVIPSALNYPEWGTAGGISCTLTVTQATHRM